MFSRSTEYALRAIIYLAQKSSVDHKIGMSELAAAIDSPKSFTAKILQKLTKDDVLISAAPGPRGGYYLTERAKQRSMMDVLELLNEEDVISGCVMGLRECSEVNPCPMHAEYKQIKPHLVNMLSQKSIADLASEMKDTRIVIRNVEKRKPSAKRK